LNHREENGVVGACGPHETPARGATLHRRLAAAVVFVACGAVLTVAAYVKPDPRGFGTHGQLGFGPCGVLIMTGYPCPTCGMTTAFAHTVRGHWGRAFLVQPAGFIMALGVAVAGLVSAWVVVTGRWPRVRLPFVTPYRMFFTLLVLLLASWGFKIVVGLVQGVLPYH
jgi:hypothetical protein